MIGNFKIISLIVLFKNLNYSHRDIKIVSTDKLYSEYIFHSLCDPGASVVNPTLVFYRIVLFVNL